MLMQQASAAFRDNLRQSARSNLLLFLELYFYFHKLLIKKAIYGQKFSSQDITWDGCNLHSDTQDTVNTTVYYNNLCVVTDNEQSILQILQQA